MTVLDVDMQEMDQGFVFTRLAPPQWYHFFFGKGNALISGLVYLFSTSEQSLMIRSELITFV
jgi:hypothetical protein